MKAIITKYLGPTNTKGSRIKATDGDNSVIVAYDHDFDADKNHWAAAVRLCGKLGWDFNALIGGHTKTGMVFVFAPK